MRTERHGSVLILAIWSLFFLGALALAVGSYVSADLRLASGLSNDLLGSQLARAGVERAIAEVACDTNAWDAFTESWADPDLFDEIRLSSGAFSVGYEGVSALGTVSTNFGLIDEESKIHIGRAREVVIKALLDVVGESRGSAAEGLAQCIVDWRDSNNKMLTVGAENGYYQGLSDPYPCHNGEFDSIDELLLVKGMTHELLEELRPHVTVFGAGLININTANRTVLRALARAAVDAGDEATQQSVVDRVLRYRMSGGVFESRASVRDWQREEHMSSRESAVFDKMGRDLDVRSTCFGGEAIGWSGERRGAGNRVAFIYDRRLQAKIYWYEF